MTAIRQLSELGPELDFLALSSVVGEDGNARAKTSRLMKSGDIIGVVKGIYVTAPELRKRPVSREALANMIYGPSYVSFEFALSRAGLIPEAAAALTSATPKRNKSYRTPVGAFIYRHLPIEAYRFGWTREELPDGAGYLIAHPEKALLDWLYLAGAVRSVRVLEERLEADLRLDDDAFSALDRNRLRDYCARMPGETFSVHLRKLIDRRFGGRTHG